MLKETPLLSLESALKRDAEVFVFFYGATCPNIVFGIYCLFYTILLDANGMESIELFPKLKKLVFLSLVSFFYYFLD
jgi:hypothetical protein